MSNKTLKALWKSNMVKEEMFSLMENKNILSNEVVVSLHMQAMDAVKFRINGNGAKPMRRLASSKMNHRPVRWIKDRMIMKTAEGRFILA